MPAVAAYAPGKVILFGEHAVVYGRPAIAVPVNQLRARAQVEADLNAPVGRIWIQAPDIGLSQTLDELPAEHPLAVAVRLTQEAVGAIRMPACKIRVSSTIPVASGLGSGAAVAVAMIRAVAAFLGHPLPDEQVCALAYEVEKLHHGTPSGIDNTVITYAMPVFFVKGQPIQRLRVGAPLTFVIGDTGVPSPTASSVADVRLAWQADPVAYEARFDRIAAIVTAARRCIEQGEARLLGELMNENQTVLQEIGVSSPALDHLISVARQSGAWGAKLSGGGRGGNMIACISAAEAERLRQALLAAGAVRAWITEVS